MFAIEHSLRAGIITHLPTDLAVRVSMRYAPDDPLAVHLVFAGQDQTAPDNHWVFGRDLLSQGLAAKDGAGRGAVCVMPLDRRYTAVELRAANGTAVVRFLTRDLRGFLAATFLLMPPGTEDTTEDLDRFLADLLTQR